MLIWEYDEISNRVKGLDNGGCVVWKAKPYGGTPEEVLGNGNLIAAAPELYGIAQMVLASASVETPTDLLNFAERIVKKITTRRGARGVMPMENLQPSIK